MGFCGLRRRGIRGGERGGCWGRGRGGKLVSPERGNGKEKVKWEGVRSSLETHDPPFYLSLPSSSQQHPPYPLPPYIPLLAQYPIKLSPLRRHSNDTSILYTLSANRPQYRGEKSSLQICFSLVFSSSNFLMLFFPSYQPFVFSYTKGSLVVSVHVLYASIFSA